MCYLNIDETVRKEDGGGGEENEPPEEDHCCHRSTLGPDYLNDYQNFLLRR